MAHETTLQGIGRLATAAAMGTTLAACPAPESPQGAAKAETDPVAGTDEPPVAPDRSPTEVRAAGNHLLGAGSLYLRQHAHNPVDWYPWGAEALERARRLDRPIFLSIGYASCHWCHVMEREVFEHDDVAALLNANFVSIKVDREERPDLDAVYMDAVQAITGGGGWPMTVFLTSALRPFTGGTYFPHDQFVALAREVLRLFRSERERVDEVGAALHDRISAGVPSAPGQAIDPDEVRRATRHAAQTTDPRWGGSPGRQKFPTPIRWRLMLHASRKWGDAEVGQALRLTLDQMASGGIHDHVGGGFHRYATDPRWVVPHFEKMLYDNAQLASLYIEAAASFDRPAHADVARDTLDFLAREMQRGAGLFASLDADSGGVEGTFYVWTPEQLTALAGEADGAALAALLGVTADGNFEGASVLTRRADPARVAAQLGRPVAEVEALWPAWRDRLREARAGRVPPGLDTKIVTSWNGLAISAFARGYAAFGDGTYRSVAEDAAQHLLTVHRRPNGTLYRASNEGRAEHDGVLDDYAFLAVGLLDLFAATGERRWLQAAKELIATADARFVAPDGGWFLTREGAEAPLGRHQDPFDAVRPSGHAAMLEALQRAASLTGDEALRVRVGSALAASAGLARRAGLGMAGTLDAALMAAGPSYQVVVAGRASDRRTHALEAAARAICAPWATVVTVPQTGPDAELMDLLPPTAGKRGRDGGPLAYVCEGRTCKAPTGDPAALRAQVLEGWVR